MTATPEEHAKTSVVADIVAAIRFFTRLQVPGAHGVPCLGRLARVVPIVGLIVGGIMSCVAIIAFRAGLPPLAAALFAIGAGALVTGALHEDGLADVADGFGGGGTVERKLEIMKDSRVGTYGVVALVVVLGLEVVLIADMLARFGAIAAFAAIIAAATLSRVAALVPMALLPPARRDGLAASVGGVSKLDIGIGFAVAALFASVGLLALFGIRGMPLVLAGCALAALITGLSLAGLAKAQIGGHTGDVAGATQKLAAVAVLATIVIALSRGSPW
jgi:adenosylcobinamide-GDP ribazoletransferase